MSELTAILKQSELFCTLTEDQIAQNILIHGLILALSKKQQIIMQRQSVEHFYVVLSGKIHIEFSRPDGERSLQAVMRPGDVLGSELICCDHRISAYDALAATTAAVISFPVGMVQLSGMIDEECRLRIRDQLLLILSRDNARKNYYLAMHSLKGLRERVAMYLLYLAEVYQSNSFDTALSRDEMPAILCVNRSCLSHELSLMEQDGMISFRKGQFVLHDPHRWKEIAGF